MKKNYDDLIKEMYGEVIKTCTAPFNDDSEKYISPERLEEIYTNTYDSLFGVPLNNFKTKNIMVFSTNYDPSIELWCQKRNIRCVDGTRDYFNPEIKIKTPIDQHIIELESFKPKIQSDLIGLIRVHGSIWEYVRKSGNDYLKFNRPDASLVFPDLYREIRKDNPALIFPGQEDYLRVGRWDLYYQYFKNNLKGPCLFIGYSFRHSVINEQIISKIQSGDITKLGIFSPDPEKVLGNLYQGRSYPNDKIVKIKGKFGTKEGLWELNRRWFIEYFQKYYQGVDDLHRIAMEWKEGRNRYYA